MTASSVEFFPCRVQLMGLPRSAGSAAAAAGTGGAAPTTSALQQTPPRRPPVEKVQGVSRNLFGSPEPGEINQLFQQETRRQHSYVYQRYNIDTNLLKTSTSPLKAVNGSSNIIRQQAAEQQQLEQEQPTQHQQQQVPTLIARELRQHEQRLRKEECNLNRAANEITPPNAKIQQLQTCGGVSKIVRRCCGDEATTPPSSLSPSSICSVERQKPYARQSLLTETFNLRKNKICGPTSSSSSSSSSSATPSSPHHLSSLKQRKNFNVANVENLCLETSTLPDTHRNVQVLLMPQAMQAEMTLIDTTNNMTVTSSSTTSNAPNFHLDHVEDHNAEDNDTDDHDDHDDGDDCTSSSSSGAECSPSPSNTTTFSLKLVVSTQNAVATTTSSASREHTHHA